MNEQEKQSTNINNLFGEECSITINGEYFSYEEWNNIVEKIEKTINKIFEEASETAKENYRELFRRDEVTIIVEKTTEYESRNVIGNGKTLYLNYKALDEGLNIFNGIGYLWLKEADKV